jgi:uncharacterized alkaline shock family protein YloU
MSGPGDNETTIPCATSLRVADDVIARIIGLAALAEPGVEGLTSTLVGGITEHLGRKTAYKGVRLTVENGHAAVDLHVVVAFGHKIPELAQRVQTRIKAQVEYMVGLQVDSVNVHVEGITFEPVTNGNDEPGQVPS